MAVSGISSGVPSKNFGKIAGKIMLEDFLESRTALSFKVSGTGKGKPAAKVGSTLP